MSRRIIEASFWSSCYATRESCRVKKSKRRTSPEYRGAVELKLEADADLQPLGIRPGVTLDLAGSREDAAIAVAQIDEVLPLERHRRAAADDEERLGQRARQVGAELDEIAVCRE